MKNMKTVNEVSILTGLSIRTLHYYDKIGLLKPAVTTAAHYRMYDDTNLERLQQIMLFRELEFPLSDIASILDAPDFDRQLAIEQQLELLTLKKKHLEELIEFTCKLTKKGEKNMSFEVFDKREMKKYAEEAKAKWGSTDAYQEYEEKAKIMTEEDQKMAWAGIMDCFVRFGALLDKQPADEEVQAEVKKLQDYITEHFYLCKKEILLGLGQMYNAGGEMTDNINKAGGAGTAEFVSKAIEIYCFDN